MIEGCSPLKQAMRPDRRKPQPCTPHLVCRRLNYNVDSCRTSSGAVNGYEYRGWIAKVSSFVSARRSSVTPPKSQPTCKMQHPAKWLKPDFVTKQTDNRFRSCQSAILVTLPQSSHTVIRCCTRTFHTTALRVSSGTRHSNLSFRFV